MASMVAKACSSNSSQMPPGISMQEKGTRNKRKFRADPPISDTSKILSVPQNDFSNYEFSAEKFGIVPNHGYLTGCDMCEGHADALKLDLGLSCAVGPFEAGPIKPKEEIASTDEIHDADWSDLTESQLEELVLNNLDTIFKSAIKKLVGFGYTKEIATKAVLRPGVCYGNKDTASNIVDNTLAFLRSGQVFDPLREQHFEDLQQMEKYILAELVCVIREVKPFFSTGDAMWCLLVYDMNVSHACAMESDPFSCLVGDGAPNGAPNGTHSAPPKPQVQTEAINSENLMNSCKQNSSFSCACPFETHSSQPEAPTLTGRSNLKPKSSSVRNGFGSEKENTNCLGKSFTAAGPPHSSSFEEKFTGGRKITGITKREYIFRHKSIQLEKSYRTYSSKGASRAGKLNGFGGLILDKKIRSVADSTGNISMKKATLKITKEAGANLPQNSNGLPPSAFTSVNNTISPLPKPNFASVGPTINPQPSLSAADTELSLSLPSKSNYKPVPATCNWEAPNFVYEKSLGQWTPRDKKEEMAVHLVKVRELQNLLQEWTEWANQKVMQAARRLSKDKAELKILKQEKEEVERLKKEKKILEENTMKKLLEMENALCKASGQVERANAAMCRLEVENAALRQEMEAANLRAAELSARSRELSKREKDTLMKIQSWDKEKNLFQEEIVADKHSSANLQHKLEQAEGLLEQQEARWKQEERANGELLREASSLIIDTEQKEASAKSKDNMLKLKAEKNLQRYKDGIEKLEKEISQLRLKTDSSKIAALRRGIDGSYASRLTDSRSAPAKDSMIADISRMVTEDNSGNRGVKRERECVMCLSEEISVIFLPCAHQVVCTACNDLHEKQGMTGCPSCRGPIMRRISVCYFAHP